MTRPYTRTKQVQTTMRPADVDRLDALADQLSMSRANLIHEAILQRLNQPTVSIVIPDPPEDETERQRVEAYQMELRRLSALRRNR